jgi:hypothetical protein
MVRVSKQTRAGCSGVLARCRDAAWILVFPTLYREVCLWSCEALEYKDMARHLPRNTINIFQISSASFTRSVSRCAFALTFTSLLYTTFVN